MTVTERSDWNPPQRRRNLRTWSGRTGHSPVRLSAALPNYAVLDQERCRYAAPHGAPATGLRLGEPRPARARRRGRNSHRSIALTQHAVGLLHGIIRTALREMEGLPPVPGDDV